jgi:alpha-mannosidase
MVYEDAEVLYAQVKRDGEAILDDALCVLFPGSVPVMPSMRSKSLGGSSKVIGFNTTFFPRWDIIRIPSLAKAGPALKNLILQASEDGKEGYGIMHCAGGGSVGELKHPSSGLHELIKPVSGEFALFVSFTPSAHVYKSTQTDRTTLFLGMLAFR